MSNSETEMKENLFTEESIKIVTDVVLNLIDSAIDSIESFSETPENDSENSEAQNAPGAVQANDPTITNNGISREFISDTVNSFDFKSITPEFVQNMVKMFRENDDRVLPEPQVCAILSKAMQIFSKEPTLVDIELGVREKLTICGDIHGQFFDLMNIFEMNNFPKPTNPYLFNGDIVDRGRYSVECILTLLCYKILFPSKFFINRGNHECREANVVYGFKDELERKYPTSKKALFFQLFQQVFNLMPLAHLINGRVLVVHGGLSGREDFTLDDIRKIERGRTITSEGLMTDLLWSDPKMDPGVSKSHRGYGILFGPDVTESFCRRNGIETIIRSHELQAYGYSSCHNGRIITVFSAPDYCGIHGNYGAYVTLKGGNLKPQYHVFPGTSPP